MKQFYRWTSNGLLALQVLLLFLSIFSTKVELPVFLQWSARLHPVLLHLPIGLFLLSALIWSVRRQFPQEGFYAVFQFVLTITAWSASVSALTGFFLSKEEGYEATLLQTHQWAGIAFSFLAYGIWLWSSSPQNLQKTAPIHGLFALGTAILLLTGHAGGQLTHGEDFLAWPASEQEKTPSTSIQPDQTFYDGYVQPLLDEKCVTCHRDGKAKGGLLLTSAANGFKGGKSGKVWVAGDPEKSLLLQRIHLPLSEKKHMPPKGKNQLSPTEIALLEAWIANGADTKLKIADIPANAPLFTFIHTEKQGGSAANYSFKPASPKVVQKLNDAFLVVRPLAANLPALQADFYIQQAWDSRRLEALKAVEEQLVVLNLGHMPATDADLKQLRAFSQLEKLTLNYTQVTNRGLEELKKLPNLQSLGLAGTKVDIRAIPVLASFPTLKEVFLWNTGVSANDFSTIRKKYPSIRWNDGYVPSPGEMLALNPPVFEDYKPVMELGDSIRLTARVPGTAIRYTLDGSTPDSVNSRLYRSPIPFKGITTVKAKAFKNGWMGSETAEKTVYQKGFKPEKTVLITPPAPDYSPSVNILTDGILGDITQFRSGKWIGYRDNPMEVFFFFHSSNRPEIHRIALSYGVNVGSYIVAPAKVAVWGGNDEKNLVLLSERKLPTLGVADLGDQDSRGLLLPFTKAEKFRVYKVVVDHLGVLPDFHPGKGTPGWAFVDEIFFN